MEIGRPTALTEISLNVFLKAATGSEDPPMQQFYFKTTDSIANCKT